jgi:opacity protein-like surface antigen
MIVCRLQGKDSVWWGTLAVVWWVSQVLLPVAVWAQSPAAMDSGANRTRQAEQAVAPEPEKYSERVRVKPTEGYIAGFGGYTFGGKFDTEGIGNLSGVSFGNRSLADSGVYGAKAGGFFSDELSWFGVELEAFNTTPNIQQQGAAPGSYMRVTTLAVNAIVRGQFSCTTTIDHTEQVTRRIEMRYEREFCRVQPYAGIGLGINWTYLSNSNFTAHDNFVPGLNLLGGLRYYVTERIGIFAEYKYNRATFDFVSGTGPLTGFQGTYSINHIVGGISYHY